MVGAFIFRQVDQLVIDTLYHIHLRVKKEYLCVVYLLVEVVEVIQRWKHARRIMIQQQINQTLMLCIQIDMSYQNILLLINNCFSLLKTNIFTYIRTNCQ